MNLSFDDLLQLRVGFGCSQYISIGVLGFIDFIDGIESLLSMLLPAIIQHEWNISDNKVELMGSLFHIGAFFGYFISGLTCEKIGRKMTMLIGNALALFTFLFTALVTEFWHIAVLRFFYGLVVSLTTPVSYLMISEITPKQIRGRAQLILQAFYISGKLYLILVMVYFMDSIVSGNWRAVAFMTVFPCTLILLGNIFFLDESPRYLLINNYYQEAEIIINRIGHQNLQNYQNLEVQEMNSLKIWKTVLFQSEKYTLLEKFQGLFHIQRLNVTWRLILVTSLLSFIGSGIYFLTPFLLHEEEKGFSSLLWMTLIEYPAIIILFFIIDIKSIGRISLYLWSHLYGIISSLQINVNLLVIFLIWKIEEPFLVTGLVMLKFGFRIQQSILTPVLTESYSTVYRAVGFAFLGSSGRIASALVPFFIFDRYNEDNYKPFLIFALIAIPPYLAMFSYPLEKTGEALDTRDVAYSALPSEQNSEQNIGTIGSIQVVQGRQNNKEVNEQILSEQSK